MEFFHVTARGNAGQTIFFDDVDYITFLRILEAVIRQLGWSCRAFCLMPTHYHLLIETEDPRLGAGMQLLNGRYARRFNVRHRRTGHVFEGPYHAQPIVRDEHLLEVCRYIALNPVRGGLCRDPAQWPWGNYDRAWSFVDSAALHGLFGGQTDFQSFVEVGVERLQPG